MLVDGVEMAWTLQPLTQTSGSVTFGMCSFAIASFSNKHCDNFTTTPFSCHQLSTISSQTMDRRVRLEDYQLAQQPTSPTSTLVCGILFLWAIHQLLVYFDYPILSPQELFWNALVYITPSRLLLDAAKRQEIKTSNMISQLHAAKSEALRRAFGMGSSTLMESLPSLQALPGASIVRRASMFTPVETASDAPPGLGNWDNSCYQNSVLQGLASLKSLPLFLERPVALSGVESDTSRDQEPAGASFTDSLAGLVSRLNDRTFNGRQMWTPAKLKNMSSWQQQDAQEYFSKIMEEVDKESAKSVARERSVDGLESFANTEKSKVVQDQGEHISRNPMEGLLAQQVVCTKCGFSEGISMIPFNCLTVPLGGDFAYDLEECLDEYAKREEISEVECAKCTLVRAEAQYKQMLPPSSSAEDEDEDGNPAEMPSTVLSLPPELREMAAKRLQAIQKALEDEDFSDKTVNETCHIPKKARVSSTKSRQAVIGRTPQALVIHINRSVFDELTGVQRKNYASVRYPMVLDLVPWMLGDEAGESSTSSMLTSKAEDLGRYTYRLKAVVTHYGRHENGHYICYRQHAASILQESSERKPDEDGEVPLRWWRLSDEEVSPVTEEDVLAQGGVFMLFYEREEIAQMSQFMPTKAVASEKAPTTTHRADEVLVQVVAQPLPSDDDRVDPALHATISESNPVASEADSVDRAHFEITATTAEDRASEVHTEDESEATDQEEAAHEPVKAVQKPPTPPLMRTARGRQSSRSDGGFERSLRAVAAT